MNRQQRRKEERLKEKNKEILVSMDGTITKKRDGFASHNYEVIDNFLPSDVFNELQGILLLPPYSGNVETIIPQWHYHSNINSGTELEFLHKSDPHTKNRSVEQDIIKLKNVITKEGNDWMLFHLIHMVYEHTIVSPLHNKIVPPFSHLVNIRALIRIKVNMYPNLETLKEHGMHIDYDFPHTAGILSMNTCDGYTKLQDGTKINSVANRMLFFDGSTLHTSSNTTDQPVRVNINFNYF